MSNNGNHYKRIQAFGTSSAFDPSSIQKSNTTLTCTNSPTRVIDVNVNLTGAEEKQIFVLGTPLPPGSVIQSASVNGHGSLNNVTSFDIILATSSGNPSDPPSVPLAASIELFLSGGTPTATGGNVNLSIVNPSAGVTDPVLPSLAVPVVAATPTSLGNLPVYPVLIVQNLPNLPLVETGTVNVKIVLFCP